LSKKPCRVIDLGQIVTLKACGVEKCMKFHKICYNTLKVIVTATTTTTTTPPPSPP